MKKKDAKKQGVYSSDVPFFKRRRHLVGIDLVFDDFGKWSSFFAVYQVDASGIFEGDESGSKALNFPLFGPITSPSAGLFPFLSF